MENNDSNTTTPSLSGAAKKGGSASPVPFQKKSKAKALAAPLDGHPQSLSQKPGKGPRGRKKERDQISVRLDSQLLKLAYTLTERGERLTDILEEGLYYVVQKRLKEPLVQKQARFLINKATPEEQRLVALFLIYLRTPGDALSIYNAVDRSGLIKKLQLLAEHSYYRDVLQTFGDFPQDS